MVSAAIELGARPSYRVKRAEELLGHAIDERRLRLELALRLSDMIDVLRDVADARARTPG